MRARMSENGGFRKMEKCTHVCAWEEGLLKHFGCCLEGVIGGMLTRRTWERWYEWVRARGKERQGDTHLYSKTAKVIGWKMLPDRVQQYFQVVYVCVSFAGPFWSGRGEIEWVSFRLVPTLWWDNVTIFRETAQVLAILFRWMLWDELLCDLIKFLNSFQQRKRKTSLLQAFNRVQ